MHVISDPSSLFISAYHCVLPGIVDPGVTGVLTGVVDPGVTAVLPGVTGVLPGVVDPGVTGVVGVGVPGVAVALHSGTNEREVHFSSLTL